MNQRPTPRTARGALFLLPLALLTACAGPRVAGGGMSVDAARELPVETAPLGAAVGVALDDEGGLWRVRAFESVLRVDRSRDQGRSFEPLARIPAADAAPQVDAEDPPQILALDGAVYVAWTGRYRGRATAFLSRSGDGGRRFAEPQAVRGTRGAPQIRTLLARDAQGVRLVFLDPNGAAGHGGRLYAAHLSAEDDAPVARPLAGGTCQCCRLDAANAAGDFLVLSRMIFTDGARDFGLIGDDGSVLRVTDDDWRIDACPEHGGTLAVAEGTWHLTWFTQGSRRQGLWYAHSSDAGRSWSPPRRLGRPDRLAGHADVHAHADEVVIAWREFDGENHSVHLLRSADGGRTFGDSVRIAEARGPADYPRLAANGDRVLLSWYAAGLGHRVWPVGAGFSRDPGEGEAATPARVPEGSVAERSGGERSERR